ncbi:MAG: hypothetical protein ACLFU2_04165 [Opitutales bacterium]
MSLAPLFQEAPLIAVLSCRAHRETRQQAVRETWARHLPTGWRLVFLEGGAESPALEGDRLLLPAPETYEDLAERMHAFFRLFRDEPKPRLLLKVDDDTFVRSDRLPGLLDEAPGTDYRGHCEQVEFVLGAPYAQGGAYALRPPALGALAAFDWARGEGERWWKGQTRLKDPRSASWLGPTSVEDMMVGDLLRAAGIPLTHDVRFGQGSWPLPFGRRLTCHPVTPRQMRRLARWWSRQPPSSP